jgi:hypothetical protein
MSELTLSNFGQEIKKANLTATISCGSGGFSVVLKDNHNDKLYGSYAWDIGEAFELAMKKYEMDHKLPEEDIPTNPSMRPDTTYKIIKK